MRIMNVTDSYLPTIGGMERAIQGLARLRTAEGHQVCILTGSHPHAPADETVDGVRVVRRPMSTQKISHALLDPERPFHATLPDPLFMRAACELIEEFQPDVIHCHGWSRFSILPVARRLGIPVVGTAHDYGFVCATKQGTLPGGVVCDGPSLGKCLSHSYRHYGIKGVPLALGLRSMIRWERDMTVTAISHAVDDFADGTRYELPEMPLIPSFIPDESLTVTDPTRPDWAPDGEYLMFVGALTPYKGITVLLEAQQILKEERGLDIPVLLIGTPQPDTPNLDRPNVTVRTNVPNTDVMRAWQHSTVGCVPSVLPEGFGQVVVEGLAAGTAMIGTNHGGIPEIITHEVDGLLVTPNDVTALADAIERLWRDRDLRDRLAAAGPARAKHFTLSAVGPRFLDIYRDAIERNAARK